MTWPSAAVTGSTTLMVHHQMVMTYGIEIIIEEPFIHLNKLANFFHILDNWDQTVPIMLFHSKMYWQSESCFKTKNLTTYQFYVHGSCFIVQYQRLWREECRHHPAFLQFIDLNGVILLFQPSPSSFMMNYGFTYLTAHIVPVSVFRFFFFFWESLLWSRVYIHDRKKQFWNFTQA